MRDMDWTAEVVGRMHSAGISGLQLAAECGFSNTYLSTVLHGKKGAEKTRQRIMDGLERLETKRLHKGQTGEIENEQRI